VLSGPLPTFTSKGVTSVTPPDEGPDVLRYIIRRLLWACVFLAVTIVTFVVFAVIPAGPATLVAGKGEPRRPAGRALVAPTGGVRAYAKFLQQRRASAERLASDRADAVIRTSPRRVRTSATSSSAPHQSRRRS
jgi:hypothetical protein